jgi:hypothetical protein
LQIDAKYEKQKVEQELLTFSKATTDKTIPHKLERPFLPVISKKNPERLFSLLYIVVNDLDPPKLITVMLTKLVMAQFSSIQRQRYEMGMFMTMYSAMTTEVEGLETWVFLFTEFIS